MTLTLVLLVGGLAGLAIGGQRGRKVGRLEVLDATEARSQRLAVENFNEGMEFGVECERSRLVRTIYSEVES